MPYILLELSVTWLFLFIEVSVPSQESRRSCTCVLRLSCLSVNLCFFYYSLELYYLFCISLKVNSVGTFSSKFLFYLYIMYYAETILQCSLFKWICVALIFRFIPVKDHTNHHWLFCYCRSVDNIGQHCNSKSCCTVRIVYTSYICLK